jgi:hypothetical protein
MNWVFAACYDARQRGMIAQDVLLNALFAELRHYRQTLQTLCNYDWVPVPLGLDL